MKQSLSRYARLRRVIDGPGRRSPSTVLTSTVAPALASILVGHRLPIVASFFSIPTFFAIFFQQIFFRSKRFRLARALWVVLLVLSLSFVWSKSMAASQRPGFQTASPLQVIELFTSQSCPFSGASDRNLLALSSMPDLLTLSFPVTYWNYTGWVDTLSQPEFDKRQARYNRRLGKGWLSTPQMIINGRRSIAGDDIEQIRQALAEARLTPMPLEIARAPDRVQVKMFNSIGAPLLILFEPQPISVKIESGKNKGQTLTYSNVVRVMRPMDFADGVYRAMLTEQERGLACAVLVEDPETLEVVSAARCD